MGVEFVDLFDKWASSYDDTVAGSDPEYKEVFEGYDEMLDRVAEHALSPAIEFGVGTGNLSRKMIERNKIVIGVEPSREMRKIASVKCPEAAIYEGDFIDFPDFQLPVQSIVSSFAFHHLTFDEKEEAVKKYHQLLAENGEIVFLDTLFQSETAKKEIQNEAKQQGFLNLFNDLEEEHYEYLQDMTRIFENNGFNVSFEQQNKFAWLIRAVKKENA
ncbi:class I SAM-dependent DNA methyltransferase [Thalassobacillus hwangdonensis]|uniref:Uncharacterized methyltransferase ACFQ2J_15675 n=1 Tax=Thalassobacillus hwangdonensis TaxID=546108 RepID=A0ABW3L4C5_9BACI